MVEECHHHVFKFSNFRKLYFTKKLLALIVIVLFVFEIINTMGSKIKIVDYLKRYVICS